MTQNAQHPGHVYVLTNPSMPGLIKVGRTERDPAARVAELSRATGVATPFELRFFQAFNDCHAAEKSAHLELENLGKRTSNDREFFAASIEDAVAVITRLAVIEQGPQAVDPVAVRRAFQDAFSKGFDFLFGKNGLPMDPGAARYHLEQAASQGVPRAHYYAGRACHALIASATPRRQLGFYSAALSHYRKALDVDDAASIEATGWAAKLLAWNQQWNESNEMWTAFALRVSAVEQPTGAALRLLLERAEQQLKYNKPWPREAVMKHRDAALREAKPGKHDRVINALKPKALNLGRRIFVWLFDRTLRKRPVLCIAVPVVVGLLMYSDGSMICWGVGIAATIAAWIEHTLKRGQQAKPHAWTRRRRRA